MIKLMKTMPLIYKLLILVFFFSGIFLSNAQQKMVKYDREFLFNDGVYLSFEEWKMNKPSITDFEAKLNSNIISDGNYTVQVNIKDSSGKVLTKNVRNSFAFVKNGIMYISNRNSGYYRMFIIGALSHYIAYYYTGFDNFDYYGNNQMLLANNNDFREFFLDFSTGESFLLTYANFKNFLKTRDPELYAEFEKTKGKRKLIHRFMLKYNEKHPIYFPVY